MQITRTSALTGTTRTLDLNVTQKQLESYYQHGMLLQAAFPNLTADEREFIKSGIVQSEWDMFVPEDDF